MVLHLPSTCQLEAAVVFGCWIITSPHLQHITVGGEAGLQSLEKYLISDWNELPVWTTFFRAVVMRAPLPRNTPAEALHTGTEGKPALC
jgi:hypothetical protein